jgi:hypothetical protein
MSGLAEGLSSPSQIDETVKAAVEKMPLKQMDGKTRRSYEFLLVMTAIILVCGIIFGAINESVVAIPIIILLIAILFYDWNFIHVPPNLVFMVVITMYVAFVGDVLIDGYWIDMLVCVLVGVILGTMGLIVAYVAMGRMPGFLEEKPWLITIESFTFGVAIYSLWLCLVFYVSYWIQSPIKPANLELTMAKMLFVSFGCLIVSGLFFLDKQGVFKHTIVSFLGKNSRAIGIEQDEHQIILGLIAGGESDNLEFKSTLRTNLQTGEKDKRMEKAVLKTVVAFLNSNGGTLLVGVDDDGKVIGMDTASFESRDKLNLHVSNLLSSQIGDEFIPFIRFRTVDFDDKTVLVFNCQPTSSPVFLKDGTNEIYFVRSGPSSVELTGIDLLKYVNNRSKMKRKKKYAAAMPQKSV